MTDRIYSAFKKTWAELEEKGLPVYAWQADPLTFWRERILFVICFIAAVFGLLALAPSVWLARAEGLQSVIFLDLLAYLTVIGIFLGREILSLQFRALAACLILFVLGAGLLFVLGPFGAGYIWLFGTSVLMSAIIGLQAAAMTLALNAVILFSVGLWIAYQMPDWARLLENPVEKWSVLAINFLVLNALITITTALILNGMKNALEKEQQVSRGLRRSEERFRSLFEDISGIAVHGYDTGRKAVYWNRASEILYGYSSGEAMGTRIEDLVLPESGRAVMVERIRGWMENNRPMENEEAIFENREGESVPVFSSRVMHAGSSGEKVLFFIDVPLAALRRAEKEKAELEEQYRQAQKVEAVGRLAGGVAHDLNNMLSPVLGYGEMLQLELNENDARREYADEILKAGMRAADLVRQLLAFSRKQPLEYKVIDLNRVISGIEKLLRRTIRENIDIEILAGDGVPNVMADSGQIEQVVLNLALNAQDAMPEGGRIIIETDTALLDELYSATHAKVIPGAYARLTVTDTGCGMKPETIEKIFEPFFSTKGEEGTGLGLATVYGTVRQHGGNVWVYSEPGRGSVFKVYLPATAEAGNEVSKIRQKAVSIAGSETICVAEDQDQVREMTAAFLRQQGYTVLTAGNGRMALDMLAGHQGAVHLLVTDVVMPGIDGKELFSQASMIHPGLKVLYMSGYTDNTIVHQGVLEGGIAFLQKPFTVRALGGKVREVLDSKQG
ncbi:MAG: ATP-binding protein [Desulfobacterales bacterium]